MAGNDSVQTGLNVFLLGETDINTALNQQSIYEMLHGQGASPSLTDASALVSAKPGAPRMIFQARQQIRRFEILNKIILGENHPFCTNLNIFCNRMVSREGSLHVLKADHTLLPTMLCKKIAIMSTSWYRNQSTSAAIVPPPNFSKLFTDIDEELHWIPNLSHTFLHQLGLQTLLSPPQQYYLPATTPVIRPLPTFTPPTHTPPPGNNLVPRSGPPSVAPPATPGQTPDTSERCNNVTFNSDLFQKYKEAPTPCRNLRAKIRANEIPILPNSKADNMTMCLAWHAKGQCNVACRRSIDHIAYTATEYAPLVTWCTANFPTA